VKPYAETGAKGDSLEPWIYMKNVLKPLQIGQFWNTILWGGCKVVWVKCNDSDILADFGC